MGIWGQSKGNMALIMALMIVPVLGIVGFSVDATRQHSSMRSLQSAVDAAVLSAVRLTIDDSLTEDEKIMAAKDFFNSNFTVRDATLEEPVVTFPEEGAIRISVKGAIPASASAVLGADMLRISASSGARFTSPSVVEAVLVLDTTRSMDGTPLADLKVAANQFVTDLLDPAKPDIKIGIVPFANHVNVGLSNRNADWIDVPDDSSTTVEECTMTGCVCTATETTSWVHPETGIESFDENCISYDCSAGAEVCGMETTTLEWFGCVKSRAKPYNNQDTRWDIDVEGFLTTGPNDCPDSEVVPLTNVSSKLTTAINALTADETTYIPTGVAWGARVLSPQQPFIGALTEEEFEAQGGKRLMVLMSDGANTRSLVSNGKHTGWEPDEANTETLLACNEVKNSGTELFVIAFNVYDTATTDLLRECATTFTHYSAVTDLAGLTEAFKSAAASVGEIALFD